jgi:hypothetical protein
MFSQGPEDADIEIRLGNLPSPSTAGEEVHVQWWSPRRSPSEFNGGNVRVSETGEVVIRVRKPATYQMHRWIAYPHIHFRLCANTSFIPNRRDEVYFTMDGPMISHSSTLRFEILACRTLPAVGDEGWIKHVPHGGASSATTIMAAATTRPTTTTMPTTTTVPETASTTMTATVELLDMRIRSAEDALDLDALEFSPVYHCFLAGLFFNQLSSDCAEECPPGSVVEYGQCVRKEIQTLPLTLEAS